MGNSRREEADDRRLFFFSSRRRHTRFDCDWSSDVCSSDLHAVGYLSTSKGIPTQAVLILSTMLWKLIREEEPDYLAVAWDPPGPTFRDALSADRKSVV